MSVFPVDWDKHEFGEILEIKSGYGFKKAEYSATGLPLIQIENVSHGFIKWENIICLPENYATEYPDLVLHTGDILIALNRPITQNKLKIARLTTEHTPAILYQRVGKVVSISDKINYGFIYYLLQRELFFFVSRKSIGSDQPYISLTELRKHLLYIPPLSEQHKIAEILSTFDEAITKTERLLFALRDQKKGLMQQLLFGQTRFAEFQKSKAKKETKYGKIPADWDYIAIESVAHHVSTKNGKGDDLPVLSCTKYDGLVDSLTYFGRQIFSEDTSTYKVVKRGQFAYATNHIEEGSIGYQNLYERALISPMYTVFETNDKVDDGFLYKLLKTELYRHIFEANTSASIDRRGSLRWDMFSQIKIPLPSLKEQKVIAEVIDICEYEITLTKQKLELLQQQKKGLMQKLLTGQIRVKV